MVMTVSNVLHMPITLFTSIPNMRTICILPVSNVCDHCSWLTSRQGLDIMTQYFL